MVNINAMSLDINSLIRKAQELCRKDKNEESKEVLLPLLNEETDKKQSFMIFTLLGGNFQELKEYEKAIFFFKKALELYPKVEGVSLGIYLCYAHLEEYDLALEEIFRFLKEHKAAVDMYKVTLEELLTDIRDGHIQKDEDIENIQNFAKEFNVKLEE